MPTNLVPVDTFPANHTVASDGEAVSQATRTLVMQGYADGLLYLRNRSPAAVAGNYQIPIAPVGLYAAAWIARWGWVAASEGWVNLNIGGADEITIPLPALVGCSFSSVTLVVHGDANAVGPHAALPASMPQVTLYKIDGQTAAPALTTVGSQVDTSANVAAYEQGHTITYTPGAAQTIDEVTQYAISVRGESGANSIASALVLYGAYMTIVPV